MCSDYVPAEANLTIGAFLFLTLICGEYFLCPDDNVYHKCSRRPNVISITWDFVNPEVATENSIDSLVSRWLDAKMMPVFSAGNYSELGCDTVSFPGDRVDVIQVGAVDLVSGRTLELREASGKGPPSRRYPGSRYVRQNLHKPDIVAPGGDIWTTTGDQGYTTASGTSTATFFVSGAIAVILSRNIDFDYKKIQSILYSGTKTKRLRSGNFTEICGNVKDDVFPNFKFGTGFLKLPHPESLGEAVTPRRIPDDS